MASIINHGALDDAYGLLIRHTDGTWSQYSSTMTRKQVDSLLDHPPYGLGSEDYRVVKYVARVLCNAPACNGHDDPDWQCPNDPNRSVHHHGFGPDCSGTDCAPKV
jgi:hypothetical protein